MMALFCAGYSIGGPLFGYARLTTVSKPPAPAASAGERASWKSLSPASSAGPRTTAVTRTPSSCRRRKRTRPTNPAAPTTATLGGALSMGQGLHDADLGEEPLGRKVLGPIRQQD